MRSFLRGTAWVSAIFAAVCLLLYLFVFDTWVVPSDDVMLAVSIEPTLRPDDRILVQRGSIPRVGQLARCASPEDPSRFVIGRVFGEGGDPVRIVNERVIVAGKGVSSRHGCPAVKLVHPVSQQEVTLQCAVEDNGAWTYSVLLNVDYPEGERIATVGPGKLYIVSDNRHLHQDSRDFDMVEASSCEHVVFRLWGSSFVDSSRRFTVLW